MVYFSFLQQNFTGNNFTIVSNIQSISVDSVTKVLTTIKKTFGFVTGLQYNYRLANHINLELRLKYNSQGGGALLNRRTTLQSNGNVFGDSSYVIAKSLLVQNQLKPAFMSAQLRLVYNKNKLGAGLNFIFPFTHLAFAPLYLKPLAVQLFIR